MRISRCIIIILYKELTLCVICLSCVIERDRITLCVICLSCVIERDRIPHYTYNYGAI